MSNSRDLVHFYKARLGNLARPYLKNLKKKKKYGQVCVTGLQSQLSRLGYKKQPKITKPKIKRHQNTKELDGSVSKVLGLSLIPRIHIRIKRGGGGCWV